MESFIDYLNANESIVQAEKLSGFEQWQAVALYKLIYLCDGHHVAGYAALPKNPRQNLDAIIFNRGGNREYGALNPEILCKYADKNYLILASQYRGNDGGTGREDFGGSDINDCIKLINVALPFVRKPSVYMIGFSRGGLMTYRCCAVDSRIKAGVIGCGIADSFDTYNRRGQDMKDVYHQLVGGGPCELPEAFELRSPVMWSEKINVPLLIGHGKCDDKVDCSQSVKMSALLSDAGKEVQLILYDGVGHSLKDTGFFQETIAWLESHPIK